MEIFSTPYFWMFVAGALFISPMQFVVSSENSARSTACAFVGTICMYAGYLFLILGFWFMGSWWHPIVCYAVRLLVSILIPPVPQISHPMATIGVVALPLLTICMYLSMFAVI